MPDPKRHFLIENSIFEPVRLTASAQSLEARAEAEVCQPPADRPIILYAGTFEVYQGLDTLIEAFTLVHEHCPEALLVLIGGTPTQVAALTAKVEQRGLAGHVQVLPRVPKAVAARYTGAAAVLVSPRCDGTNTPLKIYEQIASGVPLVATSILSHTQVLNQDVAFLVEPEPQAMAEGLTTALRDEAARERVAANARRLYETTYARPVYERKMRAMLDLVGADIRVEQPTLATHGQT